MKKKGWLIGIASAIFMLTAGGISAEAANENLPPVNISLDNIFQVPSGSTSKVIKVGTGDIVEITAARVNQSGAIWSTASNKMDLSKDFEASMYIYFGNQGSAAADGMSFVMQNADAGPNTANVGGGARIGVWDWASPGTFGYGIKNSLAIEFDTYSNGDGFDAGLNGQNHIAWGFPSIKSTYLDSNGLRRLDHKGLQYPGNLSVDKWFPFNVKWSASAKTLTYKFNNLAPVVIPVPDPAAVFGNTSTVYWGFTGSTGAQFELNRVAFEKVPGLVNATVPMTVKNQEGMDVAGKVVSSGETLTYRLEGNYLSGKQNWRTVTGKLTLPDTVNYVPNTLKAYSAGGPEISLPDSKWNGKTLTTDLGTLDTTKNIAYVTFNVKTTDVAAVTSVAAKGTLSGLNYIDNSNEVQYQIKPREAPKVTLTNGNTTQTIFSNTNYELTGTWIDPDGKQSTLHYLVNGVEIGTSQISSPANNQQQNYTYTIPANQLKEGAVTPVVVYAVDETGLESQRVPINIKVLSPPKVTLNGTGTTVEIDNGSDFAFKGTWKDLDSQFVNLYYILGNNPPVQFGKQVANPDPKGQTINFSQSVPSKDLAPGTYSLKVYAEDSEGQQTVSDVVTIQVIGTLQFTNISSAVSYEGTSIPKTLKTVKRNTDWDIRVKDTRRIGGDWRVDVTLEQPFANQAQKKLSDGLFFKNGTNITPLKVGDTTTVFSKKTTDFQEVPVTWSEDQGLLMNISPSDYTGKYQGVLNWTLVDGPS
ncbi:L-type lectin-domain containing protein [Carnobacterium gallinarum]|uniref:L-type lectin-domain containing protein n=1 Tax=Carnobacterium gallinarum TaxID=2749 RepID=UPI00068A9B49|nr:L-type lectin-domain containing protein [Carnobacterium gallinarum]